MRRHRIGIRRRASAILSRAWRFVFIVRGVVAWSSSGLLSQVSKRDHWNPAESPYSLFPAPCSLLFSLHLLGDIQQNADAGQGDKDGGAAGGDQRQRNALGGQKGKHHADIEEGLQQDRRGDAEGGEAGE